MMLANSRGEIPHFTPGTVKLWALPRQSRKISHGYVSHCSELPLALDPVCPLARPATTMDPLSHPELTVAVALAAGIMA